MDHHNHLRVAHGHWVVGDRLILNFSTKILVWLLLAPRHTWDLTPNKKKTQNLLSVAQNQK